MEGEKRTHIRRSLGNQETEAKSQETPSKKSKDEYKLLEQSAKQSPRRQKISSSISCTIDDLG